MQKKRDSAVMWTVVLTVVMMALILLSLGPAMAMVGEPQVGHYTAQEQHEGFGKDADEPGSPSGSDTESTVLLPMALNNHSFTCSTKSPFSLEIAALHQVEPSPDGTYSTRAMTDAEWWALYQNQFPTLVEALEKSGACWTRVRVDWAAIQPEPPPAPYNWADYHDERLRLVAETGVHVIAIIDGVPKWAGDSEFGPIVPHRLEAFRQFLTALVQRYKEPPYNIHHWELFNEPDRTFAQSIPGGWGYEGDRYAQMLAVAYPAIKAADPQATVLLGGLAHDGFTEYGGLFYRYFPDDVLAAGGGPYMDVVNLHYFPDFSAEWERWDPKSEDRQNGWLPAPTCGDLFDGQGKAYEAGGIDIIAKISHVRNRLATCYGLNKAVWITEMGEHGYANDANSLVRQARYVIQGYARGLASGAKNITWYALVSPPYDGHDQGLLFQGDWSPKPAFYAYQTMTRELAGYSYARTEDVRDVEAYVFLDAAGEEKTVAWTRYPQEPGLLTISGERLRIMDRWGVESYVNDGGLGDLDGAQNGSITLQMTADPVFLSE